MIFSKNIVFFFFVTFQLFIALLALLDDLNDRVEGRSFSRLLVEAQLHQFHQGLVATLRDLHLVIAVPHTAQNLRD